ncbi:ABC transporter ATP-binding protein [Sporichthya polymorpha]|uniref:ABC transporter ATP-binding protein n=1 Tax=Sporichthya polymorpha TaxID=35751 RepID=UPI00035C5CDD|nr:ABC transporter ATP-binding protein [Sporichthya polymorpha]
MTITATEAAATRAALAGLHIDGLVIRFGGHTAVDHLTMSAPIGQVTGLIGPNGAGKSTTFNACSGSLTPSEGSITFDGVDLTKAPESRRAHLGIGRTFQRIELFDSLSVAENVALGREARLAGVSPVTQLLPRRGERSLVMEAAQRAMEQCGISELASARAGRLSTGQRRLVELARALAGDFRLLLLDEPSSGLDHSESDAFTELLRHVVAENGIGILIVEHDMTVISGLCDYAYVLDFGQLIFEGVPSEVLTSDIVRKAYLGTEDIGVGGH